MREAVDRFLGQAVEGIIVIAFEMAALEALAGATTDVPLVAVGWSTGSPGGRHPVPGCRSPRS